MPKALNRGVLGLTRVCQVTRAPGHLTDWQTGVILSIHKKGNMSECTNCWVSLSLASLEKCIAKCLEQRCREIIEPKLEDTQCDFRLDRSASDPIFIHQQLFEKSWEYAKDVLSTSIKHSTGSLGKSCRSSALTAACAACYWWST